MRRFPALALLLFALPVLLPAGEFDWMVREFSRQSGVQQMHIPFLGLARFAVAVTRPAGTSGLRLAVFEHPNIRAEEFSHVADSVTGNNWKPIIRVRSRDGETTNIYIQPEGKHLRLLIATLDGGEATLVELRLQPESLVKFVDEHNHNHHAW